MKNPFDFSLFVFHFSLTKWRITDSNRWPPACKAGALASWANPPSVNFDFWMLSFDLSPAAMLTCPFLNQFKIQQFKMCGAHNSKFIIQNSKFLRVVPGRLELPTSTLSVWRSNQLSYRTVGDFRSSPRHHTRPHLISCAVFRKNRFRRQEAWVKFKT